MYLLDEGMEEPKKTQISSDSNLYRVLTAGNEDCNDVAMPNAAPTMIKDTADTPLIVFNSFQFKRGVPDVYFYDLKTGQEIARAQSAHLFVKYMPSRGGSDKIAFLRVPQFMADKGPISDHDGLKACQAELEECITTSSHVKGFPTWYTVTVDFAKARQASEVAELITLTENEGTNILHAAEGKSSDEIAS